MATNQDVKIRITGDATGFGAAVQSSRSAIAGLQGAVAAATGVYGALATAAAAALAALSVKGTIDAADQLNKLSQKTGITVENLSALKYAGELTDVSLEDLATGIRKLGNNMAAAAGGSKESRAAFDAMGVSFKNADGTLRSTDAVLADIANKFSSYEDGAGKAALATELFGKNGAALIPFLNQGAAGLAQMREEAGKFGILMSDSLAKQAEEFNDNMKRLTLSSEALKIQIVGSMLPALNDLAGAFVKSRLEGESLWGFFTRRFGEAQAQQRGLVREWMFGPDDPKQGLNAEIAATIDAIENLEAKLASGRGSIQASQRLDALRAKLKDLNTVYAVTSQTADTAAQAAARQALRKLEAGIGDVGRAAKKQAPVVKKDEQKTERDDYTPLIKQLEEKLALEKADLEQTAPLTEAEKLRVKVLADLNLGVLNLNEGQKAYIKAKLDDVVSIEKLNLAEKALAKERQQSIVDNANAIESEQQRLGQMQEAGRAAAEQLSEFGLSREALQHLTAQREADSIASLRQRAAALDTVGAFGDLRQLYIDQAQALEELSAKKAALAAKEKFAREDPGSGVKRAVDGYIEEVKNAGDAMERVAAGGLRSLEDGLTGLFTKGKFDVKSLVDTMIAEFVRLQVVKPMLANIFGGGSGGGGLGALAGLFGGGGASSGAELSALAGLPIGTFAAGGSPPVGRVSLVGENGPELFVPKSAGTIVPNHALQAASGGDGGAVTVNVTQNITVGAGVNASQLGQALAQSEERVKAAVSNQIRRGSRAYS